MNSKLFLATTAALALLAGAPMAAETTPGAATTTGEAAGQESYATRLTPEQFVEEIVGHNWAQRDIARRVQDGQGFSEAVQQLAREIGENAESQNDKLKDVAQEAKVAYPEDFAQARGVYQEVPAGKSPSDPVKADTPPEADDVAWGIKMATALEDEQDVYQRAIDSAFDADALKEFATSALDETKNQLEALRETIDAQALAETPDDAGAKSR